MFRGKLYDPCGYCLGLVRNFYRELGETKMTIELDTRETLQFNPGDLLRDRQGDWHIKGAEEHVLDAFRYTHFVDRMIKEASKKKEAVTMTAASIKKVIFNPPATVVYWSDGSKTVVKCNIKDNFDPEKGLAMAVAKRCASNCPDFYKEMRKWVKKSGYKQPMADTTEEKAKVNTPKPSAPEHSSEKFKKAVANAKEHYNKYTQAATNGKATTAFEEYTALGAALNMIEYLANE